MSAKVSSERAPLDSGISAFRPKNLSQPANSLERFKRYVPVIALLVEAIVVTTGFGHGNIIGEGVADLHTSALEFLKFLNFSWEPHALLGSNNGFTQVYITPYSWVYALCDGIRLSPVIAQRIVVFLSYAWIALGMYWGMRFIAPGINRVGRFAAGSAYLCNIYVAFNSAGSLPMLLTYASLPCVLGAVAGCIDKSIGILKAGALVALFVFLGSGINPPLIAMNVVVIALFVISKALWQGIDREAAVRAGALAATAALLAVLINLYWIVPFLDYFHAVWINGVLDESPLMHNADSSYANVFRGLGQWSIFASGSDGPYYLWASAYQVGTLFSFLLWVVPLLGISSILFKRRNMAVPFLLLTAFISIPLAVGYYHGPIGDALTKPIYDVLYNRVPGFQMFRSAYKWVGPYEFAAAGLFGITIWWLSEKRSTVLAQWQWPAKQNARLAVALSVLPLLIFLPVVLNSMNVPMPDQLPEWMLRERAQVGNDPTHRVALFPSQYMERFMWGDPGFYVEHGLIDYSKPMIAGYLGAATNEGSDEWMRLAYRRARQGDPVAADAFRVLSTNQVLQRDDFRSDQDFAFPDQSVEENATGAHDILSRSMGLRETEQFGANRIYEIPNALPLVYGVVRPGVAAGPAISVPTSSNIPLLARGHALVSIDGDISTLRSLIVVGARPSANDAALDDYATTLLYPHSPSIEMQRPRQIVTVARSGWYRVEAVGVSAQFSYPLPALTIDKTTYNAGSRLSHVWEYFGEIFLKAGEHSVRTTDIDYLSPVVVTLVSRDEWMHARTVAARVVRDTNSSAYTVPIKSARGEVAIARSGVYDFNATTLNASDGINTFEEFGDPFVSNMPTEVRARELELPYVPTSGVVTSEAMPLPREWYSRASTYRWNRSVDASWLLLTNKAHFTVFSPARVPITAVVQFRYVPLGGASRIEIAFGSSQTSLTVEPAKALRRTPASLESMLSYPSELSARLTLKPGMNVVRFAARDGSMMPANLVQGTLQGNKDPYFGAIASDLAFVVDGRHVSDFALPNKASILPMQGGARITSPRWKTSDDFAAAELAPPHTNLHGSPRLVASIAGVGTANAYSWFAKYVQAGDRLYYRIHLVGDPQNPNGPLLDDLPNAGTDQKAILRNLWFVTSPNQNLKSSSYDVSGIGELRTGVTPEAVGNVPFLASQRTVQTLEMRRGDTTKIDLRPLGATARQGLGLRIIMFGASKLVPSLEEGEGSEWRLVGAPVLSSYDGRSTKLLLHPNREDIVRDELYVDDRPATSMSDEVKNASDVLMSMPGAKHTLEYRYEPASWVAPLKNGVVLSVPGFTLRRLDPGAKLRLVIRASWTASRTARSISIDEPEIIGQRSAPEKRPLVVLDGKAVRGRMFVSRGVHTITSAIAGLDLDTVTISKGAGSTAIPVTEHVKDPSNIDVTVKSGGRPFLLVMNQSYFPQWIATDGKVRLKHVVVNGFANGWLVPSERDGTTLSLQFASQRKFDVVAMISGLAFFACLGMIALSLIRERWSAA